MSEPLRVSEAERMRHLLEMSPAWRAEAVPADVVAPITPGSGLMWIDVGNRRDIYRYVVTVITQVVVDRNDPAFQDPNKPIGTFMTEVRG